MVDRVGESFAGNARKRLRMFRNMDWMPRSMSAVRCTSPRRRSFSISAASRFARVSIMRSLVSVSLPAPPM